MARSDDFPAPLRPRDEQRLRVGEGERQAVEDETAGAAAGEVLDGDPHPRAILCLPCAPEGRETV